MGHITEMNRDSATLLGHEAQAALEVVAQKYGLVLTKSSGSFGDGAFTTKWVFSCVAEDGTPADFARKAGMVGLCADDYGREFRTRHGVFSVYDIKPRNRKYPIIAKCVTTGDCYKFPVKALELSALWAIHGLGASS